MRKLSLLFSSIIWTSISFGQLQLWTKTSSTKLQQGFKTETTSNHTFHFDIHTFKNVVKANASSIKMFLPSPTGEMVQFELKENTTISNELAAKYPEIKAFNGFSMDGTKKKAKIDIGPNYFRAMILEAGQETVYIDPAFYTNSLQTEYVIYKRSELISSKSFECHQKTDELLSEIDFEAKAIQSCELRTYRVAISATGEYTRFHGGTIANALAAQVTTLNRVNGLYEKDLAITLTLIANNDTLIYTDAATDPFTNGEPSRMISENQAVTNSIIGASRYDIGHIFGTNSGGLASLNCVCRSNKAQGVTGSGAPVGDAFDIDYVAHEMGHQFGANHTFNNSCSGNRNSTTAYETGSGSTIMAYAGICAPNVQGNSDDYFHAISLQEIGTAISASSHSCPVKTPLSNVAPTITSIQRIVVPANTPFMLKGNAIDADGDSLTYCWEQMDREITTQAPKPEATKGPNFRSFKPSASPIRYIPSIQTQLSNNYTWEKLATVPRDYNFRLTVRDNSENGGCTENTNTQVSVDTSAGPFVVLYPNLASVTWTGLTTQEVLWDVAKTNLAPISCENVKISLSIDGGLTFMTLIESTPNDGSEFVNVPNVSTTNAIIMVSSESETFFDVSNRKFRINQSTLSVADENMAKNLTLYPNPTTSVITLQLENGKVLNGFDLYNSVGQIVNKSSADIENKYTLDLTNLASGIYIFQSTIEGQKISYKLIKE